MTAVSLADFRQILSSDQTLTLNYLVAKLGFDYSDPYQYEQGIALLAEEGLIEETTNDPLEAICQIYRSLTAAEFSECRGAT